MKKKNMMKWMQMAMMMLLMAAVVVSCKKDDDDDDSNVLQNEYFTVTNGTFHSGSVPSATTTETIGDVTVNSSALSGGFNFVTVRTTKQYRLFYVYVRGVDGYFEFTPTSSDYTYNGTYYIYTIPILYSENLTIERHWIVVVGVTFDDEITSGTEKEIRHVDSQSGDLAINLTFDQAKDVDLHLYMPDGSGGELHIYYGNRGGYILDDNGSYMYDENGTTRTWGLDHDSNAGCSLDYLNNENIVIPVEYLYPGEYTVKLDMYSNCSPRTNPTRCDVVARFQGQILRNLYGQGYNPITLTYDANASSGDHTTIMKFMLTQSQVTRARAAVRSFSPIAPTDMDLMKMEEAEWRAQGIQ